MMSVFVDVKRARVFDSGPAIFWRKSDVSNFHLAAER
jgi:hypothetical protein